MTTALAGFIEAEKSTLSARVCAAMYKDPFWQARFSERGRAHAEQDSLYHVTYLLEALRGGGPCMMENYACWLRSLLVPRGMCSRHLAQNFKMLAVAIKEASSTSVDAALRLLDMAAMALVYKDGPAAVFAESGLEESAFAAAEGSMSDECKRASESLVLREHAACYASYFIDALALDRADLFESHSWFMAELYKSRGYAAAPLHAAIATISSALTIVDSSTRERAEAILLTGQKAFPEATQ